MIGVGAIVQDYQRSFMAALANLYQNQRSKFFKGTFDANVNGVNLFYFLTNVSSVKLILTLGWFNLLPFKSSGFNLDHL